MSPSEARLRARVLTRELIFLLDASTRSQPIVKPALKAVLRQLVVTLATLPPPPMSDADIADLVDYSDSSFDAELDAYSEEGHEDPNDPFAFSPGV